MSKQAEKERRYGAEGKKLAALLDERGIGPSEFARMLDKAYKLKAGPMNVTNWKSGRGFNPKNQSLCAALLDVPEDYFEAESRPQPATPDVRNPALAKLLQERKLRRFTVETLRAIDARMILSDEAYWAIQADLHEGIAASQEAARFKQLPKAPQAKAPAARPRKPGSSDRV